VRSHVRKSWCGGRKRGVLENEMNKLFENCSFSTPSYFLSFFLPEFVINIAYFSVLEHRGSKCCIPAALSYLGSLEMVRRQHISPSYLSTWYSGEFTTNVDFFTVLNVVLVEHNFWDNLQMTVSAVCTLCVWLFVVHVLLVPERIQQQYFKSSGLIKVERQFNLAIVTNYDWANTIEISNISAVTR